MPSIPPPARATARPNERYSEDDIEILEGLEPVRLEISGQQLVLEAGLEDRWLLSDLPADEAEADDIGRSITHGPTPYRRVSSAIASISALRSASDNSRHLPGRSLVSTSGPIRVRTRRSTS